MKQAKVQAAEQRFVSRAAASIALADRFRQIFGVPLKKYYDIRFGLKIVELDDDVVKSGPESMRNTVLKNYGEEAVSIIEALI